MKADIVSARLQTKQLPAGYPTGLPDRAIATTKTIPSHKSHTKALLQKLVRRPSPLKNPYHQWLKRTADVIASTLMVLLVFPWMLPILAILIKTDSAGPVFFIQRRHKRNGKIFGCIKFRTMEVNEEADTRPTVEEDIRITHVGRFLRRYHIDELPQLINVILGDMSLIGPRPHMIAENKQFQKRINEWNLRNEVRPGITGLSQSLGNFGATDNMRQVEDRLLFDLIYIKNWSLSMEIRIIFRTFRRMASR
ncbi:MAG TPA: sugar transferase [Puia sp.]|nr:sugar transferase [Puia sp.]